MDEENIESLFEDEQVEEPTVVEQPEASEESSEEHQESQEGEDTQEEDREPLESTDQKESEPEENSKETQQDSWTKSMALDERKKRQELEREVEELKRQMAVEKNPPIPKKIPDPIDDPEGLVNHVNDLVKEQVAQTRYTIGRDLMRDKYDDYDDKEKAFNEMAKENPTLVQQAYASANPAKFAYETVSNHENIQRYQDPNFVANEREKIRNEILAEMANNQNQELAKPSLKSRPNLTQTTSLGSNTVQKLNNNFDIQDLGI